ncbi:hypothetical protein H5410_033618 [Solanum commersonii]|uniref:Uncharacterized protein n=1 Tax=Solanum commersonii TaxID=4109 RepID=A0A9J5YRB9_SOLCO|nr:hypothetical protein H5410_033618 [Solanum commersonii]
MNTIYHLKSAHSFHFKTYSSNLVCPLKVNFNLGDCSNNNDEDFSSSSSSLLDLNFFPSTEHHDNLINQLHMNNYMFQQVLQNHTNEVFIGGSIPSHVVINCDREAADDILPSLSNVSQFVSSYR